MTTQTESERNENGPGVQRWTTRFGALCNKLFRAAMIDPFLVRAAESSLVDVFFVYWPDSLTAVEP